MGQGGLAPHPGCRDKAHIDRWMKAMLAARLEKPRCVAIKGDGRPCRNPALPGLSSGLCRSHLRGRLRERWDATREIQLMRIASGLHGRARSAACGPWASSRRSASGGCCAPGCTIRRSPAPPSTWSRRKSKRVRQILFKDFGLDIDAEQGNGRLLTPRALDRCLWAGALYIRGVLDHERARRRLVLALADDAKFWSRSGKAEEVLWE